MWESQHLADPILHLERRIKGVSVETANSVLAEFSNPLKFWILITHNCSNVLMCKESFVPLSFSVSLSTTSHNYILKEKEREKLFCIWVGEPEQEGGEGRKHRKPDQKPIDLNHISQSEAGLLFHCIASFYPSIFWENSFKKEEKLFPSKW